MNSPLEERARVVKNEGLSASFGVFRRRKQFTTEQFLRLRTLKIDTIVEPYLSRSIAKIWRQFDVTGGRWMRVCGNQWTTNHPSDGCSVGFKSIKGNV